MRIEVEILDLSVLEEAGQAHPVIRKMWLLSDDNNIIFTTFNVELDELLDERDAHHAKTNNDHSFPLHSGAIGELAMHCHLFEGSKGVFAAAALLLELLPQPKRDTRKGSRWLGPTICQCS